MTIDVWEILNRLEYVENSRFIYQPSEQQLKVLKELEPITDEQIKELTNQIKSWEAGIALRYLGYPRVKNFIPELLEMLQDLNWPAAGYIADLLRTIGKPLVPYIKHIFHNVKNDDIWFHWILSTVINSWSKELVLELKTELIEIFKRCDIAEGTSIDSLIILFKNELIDKNFIITQSNETPELIDVQIESLTDLEQESRDYMVKILVEQGKNVLPFVKERFSKYEKVITPYFHYFHSSGTNAYFSSEEEIIYSILSNLIINWPKELVLEIKEELNKFRNILSFKGINIEAIKILAKNDIEEKEYLYNNLKRHYFEYSNFIRLSNSMIEQINEVNENYIKD